jgi:hypothetical protein
MGSQNSWGVLWAFPGWMWENPRAGNHTAAFGWYGGRLGDGQGWGSWNQPPQFGVRPMDADRSRPTVIHTGTCLVGIVDGSVRGVSSSVTQPTWQNAIVPDDGSTLGSDW